MSSVQPTAAGSSRTAAALDLALVTKQRIPYYSQQLPFILAWSQKAGCTAVLKWFLYQAGRLEEAQEFVSNRVGLNVHTFERQVLHADPAYTPGVIAHLQAGGLVVNFVRCPFQRAFSSYMALHTPFLVNQDHKQIRSAGLSVRRDVLAFVYGCPVSVDYPISFLDYLTWLQGQNLAETERHHAPQHSEIYKHVNIRHYRLEDFDEIITDLEREFGLKSSAGVRNRFASGHHRHKSEVSRSATLKLLERGMALRRSQNFALPRVTRELLSNTVFEEKIQGIFSADIALYDSLQ